MNSCWKSQCEGKSAAVLAVITVQAADHLAATHPPPPAAAADDGNNNDGRKYTNANEAYSSCGSKANQLT